MLDLVMQSGLVPFRLRLDPQGRRQAPRSSLKEFGALGSADQSEQTAALLSLLDEESRSRLQALEGCPGSRFSSLRLRLRCHRDSSIEVLARLRCRLEPGGARLLEGWLLDASLIPSSPLADGGSPSGLWSDSALGSCSTIDQELTKPTAEIRLHLNAGRIVWVSSSLRQLLGWSPQEWLGHDLERFLHPESFLLHDASLASVAPGAKLVIRDRILAKDSHFHWLDIYAYPLLNGQGQQDGLAAIMRPSGHGLIDPLLADQPGDDQQLSIYWLLSEPELPPVSDQQPAS